MKYVDPSGHIAIVPLLLKAGAGGTADLMLQIFVNRYFNPEVSNVQEALGEVNWWQVTRSAGEAIIKTTMVHPFYVVKVGWVEAQDLAVGDLLKLVTGEEVVVSDIQSKELEIPVKVYNFKVADWHTYYVSELGVLVHNKGSNSCGEFGDELVEGMGEAPKIVPSENGYFGTVGKSGNNKVRNAPGGNSAAIEFYDNITQGYTKETVHPNGAKVRTMPDGTEVTYRAKSNSDGTPAVDINKGSTYKPQKIHFVD